MMGALKAFNSPYRPSLSLFNCVGYFNNHRAATGEGKSDDGGLDLQVCASGGMLLMCWKIHRACAGLYI